MRFCTEKRTLKSFCRAMGDIAIEDVDPHTVLAFIAGTGPVTRFWHKKRDVLFGFYRFAMLRGYAKTSPVPTVVPKVPQAFTPYIYSREEIRRLLQATDACDNPRGAIQAYTCRALITLLYGAGLRISEALALTLGDMDLPSAVIRVRDSKFFKTRLVPLGPDLVNVLTRYAATRRMEHSGQPNALFFVSRAGGKITVRAADATFSRLRVRAGVRYSDGGRFQPRLHDLRHAFALHRLVAWYRQGDDVQRLLPQLATYLGHVHIASTQRYLTMTPELLREASKRFERYVWEGSHA
jgi:site-specific recombinase XerD